ncbi:hypothetical protein H0176_23745 [Methylorubrum populi]|uniref:hypothetical protein n=1 Tax=Methylorubrum rhodesianum TaxID=29427 RepID=UPI0019097E58|nr:hypothetical protein [Methylorubrum rhodesianum]MBK3406248.1 hypothetical protein [Methylorubrum rhodesianum]MBY0143258.1 hypothetical protein [Methylorubrum populi]
MGERTFIDVIGDSIVNPRCDDCGMAMSTPRPDQIGLPRQCGFCQQKAERIRATEMSDRMSQERPRGRRVHVVKLPDCMKVLS